MSRSPLMSRELHDKWKSDYRTPENFKFYRLAYGVIHEYLGKLDGLVLDAGCGTGEKTIRLAEHGYRVIGVDFTEVALNEAYGSVAKAGYAGAVRIARADLTNLPFRDGTFEAIVVWGVFMHIPDLEDAIAELCRVLKPSGKIVVYDANAKSLDATLLGWAKRITARGRTARTNLGIENWVDSKEGPILVRWMYYSVLRDLFNKNGVAFERHRAGRFTEMFVYLKSALLRRVVHSWNNAYFKYVRWPLPSYAVMIFGERRDDCSAESRAVRASGMNAYLEKATSETGVGPELVCPEDGQPLMTERGWMACPSGHRWSIEGGILRVGSQIRNYADAFGLQWKTYRRTQLDSHTKTTLSLDRARRCLGEDCWEMLNRSKRTTVLEVGCGAGRFTEVLLATGACVTSVDLSAAVEANQENFPQNERHRVIQADVLKLPFAPQQYDVVFCLGVIQHTPNPETTIDKLYQQLKPGGWLVIDHYTYNLSAFSKSAPLFRMISRQMSPERGLQWCKRLVDMLLPVHRAVRNNSTARMLLTRVSPVLTYYHALPLDDDLQREWALLDTHDSLTDRYKHFRTKGQIERRLKALGAEAIWCSYGGNGVEARARRPTHL